MDGEEGAVKEHLAVARHPDGGKVLHLQVADLVGLVLDVDPAELRCREFLRQREESRPVFGAGVAPRRSKTTHVHNG